MNREIYQWDKVRRRGSAKNSEVGTIVRIGYCEEIAIVDWPSQEHVEYLSFGQLRVVKE